MPYSFFNVADHFFCISYTPELILSKLLPSFAPFHVENQDTSSDNTLFQLNVSQHHEIQPESNSLHIGDFDAGGAKHCIYKQTNNGYYIKIHTPEGLPACTLITSPNFDNNTAYLHGADDTQAFGLNNATMICFAFSGAFRKILLIHSSTIMIGENAYLFLGKSGTGKSTHSSIWLKHLEGTELYNADNPALRIDASGAVYVYGTPWSGKTPCYKNLRKNAASFLKLEQYPENIITRLSPIHAMAEILSSVSSMAWDKPTYNAICTTIGSIIAKTPTYHLKNLPNKEAAFMSYEAMSRRL
jgi:hypothetical protein